MNDMTGAPAGGEAVADLPVDAPESFESANEAASYFTSLVEKRNKSPAESAETATADPELSGEDNAGPETVPGETDDADPEAEKLPPIERPRSWSKDDDDDWNALPRARQEKIATNERAREADINQRINKAAETAKAAEAERATIAEERQKYISGLVTQDKSLEQEMAEKFPNIKSMSDLEFLANEALRASNDGDPVRASQIQAYLTAFNTHSQKIATVRADLKDAEHRQANEQRAKWTDHIRAEGAKFAESLSAKDKAKITEFMTAAPEFMEGRGFTRQELIDHWDGGKLISFHDHRVQSLILDVMKYRNLQAAPKAVVKPDTPPVQRPGTARQPGAVSSEREQALTRKSELSVAEATELYTLQQSRQQRRAS